MQALWLLPGCSQGIGYSANRTGRVVGVSYKADPESGEAFLWKHGRILALPAVKDYTYSAALSVNDKDVVAGYIAKGSWDRYNERQTRVVIWDAHRLRDIGTLGGNSAYACAINNLGQVAGKSDLPSRGRGQPGFTHAFLWQRGKMRDLGTLRRDPFSIALAVNDHC